MDSLQLAQPAGVPEVDSAWLAEPGIVTAATGALPSHLPSTRAPAGATR